MCLRCDENIKNDYCESCMQEVIAENAKLKLENKELSKAAIETAFDDMNKNTEILCRVLLKYNKIRLENGFYQRDKLECEDNMTLVGFEIDREKIMYVGKDENLEYIEQLEYKLKKAEKEIEKLKEYKWKAENANLQLEIKNIKNVSMKLNKHEQKALEYFGSETLSATMFHGFILKQLVEKQWMIIDKLEIENKELKEYKCKYEDLCD